MTRGCGTSSPSSDGGGQCADGSSPPCLDPTVILEIVDRKNGTVISGTNQTRIVGQKIQLQVRSKPPGHSITDIQWSIPNQNVKGYTQSTASGTVTNLTPADKNSSNIDFHWIDGGAKPVQVSAKVEGVPKSAAVTFNILRPTMNHFTITTSSVNVTTSHWNYPGEPALAALQPTPPPMKFGSQWDAQVTAPTGGGGEIGFTQLINANRTRTSNAGVTEHLTSGGAFVLDEGLGIQYSGSQPIAAGASATLNGAAYADSPGTPLTSDLSSKSVNESFQLRLMYKHSDSDSIWVTLGLGTWGWSGSANRTGAPAHPGNNWTLGPGAAMPRTAPADSTSLPEWSSNFGALSWH